MSAPSLPPASRSSAGRTPDPLHVVVTGAEGFVGRALVRRLLADGLGGRPVTRLTAMDLRVDAAVRADPRVVALEGSVADAAVRAQAWRVPADVVFHLASVPGGAAERDYAAGRAINLDATLGLVEDLRDARAGGAPPPRLVFASTIAVYGEDLPARVDERTLPAPALTYGAHKLASEALVADASRRGWVQGCSLRLPGVVARPGDGAGLLSAFMSRLFHAMAADEPIVLPVSRDGVAWWISVGACVDNLRLAATIDPSRLPASRCCQMPVLRLAIGEVVDALARRHGDARRARVTYAPDPFIQRLFASYPPLDTPGAEALGFRADADVDELVARATAS